MNILMKKKLVKIIKTTTNLFSTVDDIFGKREAANGRSSYNRMMPRGCVRHFHRVELKE